MNLQNILNVKREQLVHLESVIEGAQKSYSKLLQEVRVLEGLVTEVVAETVTAELADPNFIGERGRRRSGFTRQILLAKDQGVGSVVSFKTSADNRYSKRKTVRKVVNAMKYVSKITGARFSRKVGRGFVTVTRVA